MRYFKLIMMEIYKNLFRIKKEEIFLSFIIFAYVFLRSLFFEKLSSFYFIIFLFEIYLTVSVYCGIKKIVYGEEFAFLNIFRDGLYFLPSILLYHFSIGLSAAMVYLLILSLINSIRAFSLISFFLFFLIILWGAIPLFFLFLTLYSPFIIICEEEMVFKAIEKSFKFMRGNLEKLVVLFFPFLCLWTFFFTFFQKYDKISSLKIFLLFVMSFIEILTVKLVFLNYKGVKDERNV